jgi:adenylyltransferase/sulfurtransferase
MDADGREVPERYARQVVLAQIGPEGQQKLLSSTALIVGCGALGCTQAQLLARAGVGRLVLVDRDFVELNNLQRQLLYDEEDAQQRLPKAEAAARHLRRVNSSIRIEPQVADATARNIVDLVAQADVVLDATDNVETRYLVNDACVSAGRPWVYGGAVGTSGVVLAVRPGEGPCLRCVFPEPAPPGTLPTCDVAGVLNAAPVAIAALQVVEATKILLGVSPEDHRLHSFELWSPSFRSVKVRRESACRCCGARDFEFLRAQHNSTATSLCGRNAVQVTPARPAALALEALGRQLAAAGRVTNNGLLLQFVVGSHELVIFPDGRAIVRGTSDPAVARSLYAKYVGG